MKQDTENECRISVDRQMWVPQIKTEIEQKTGKKHSQKRRRAIDDAFSKFI